MNDDTPATEKAPQPIGIILETLEHSPAPPTTPPQSQGSNESSNSKPRIAVKEEVWVSRFLQLQATHPKILNLKHRVFEFCREYAKNPSRGRTLVLFGPNGCGKTHTLKRVATWARGAAMNLPLVNREDLDGSTGLPWVYYSHWPSVVDQFQKSKTGMEAAVEDLQTCSLACIDDIGAEHDPSGYGQEQLYLVLTRREFRWNIVTMNYGPDSWAVKMDKRIASRLFRNAEHIDLSGVPDYSTL